MSIKIQTPLGIALLAMALSLSFSQKVQASPIGSVTFKDNAPFAGCSTATPLSSADGLLTVAAWADNDATTSASLYQWWWIFGVDSGTGNGALLDGTEAMTLQYDKGVGPSTIVFLYTGGTGGANNLAQISVSGFVGDPGAFAVTATSPRISNLVYTNGTLTFDYLNDGGGDYGQLLFSNPAAAGGKTLKITGAVSPNGDATGWGAALFSASWQETFGGATLSPVNVRQNQMSSYTTPDGAVTARAYSDANGTTPANFGTYLDQCFGVFGAANNGAIDTDEIITFQFVSGIGLARLDTIYSSGQVTISGFAEDPGFVDAPVGSSGAAYAGGVLTFTPVDGGRHIYFFTNRAASAGSTLRVKVDPAAQLAIAGLQYVSVHTLMAGDVPNEAEVSHSTADGLLKISAFSDTPGVSAAYLHENVDWFGISGGNNTEAIDGTESLQLQFSGGAGLSSFGTRYTSGQVVLSGFASDPGFEDPSGTATAVSYSNGTLNYTFNSPNAPEHVVNFRNIGASANQSLSLHTDGNAASQIALTRITYSLGTVSLSFTKSGNSLILTWPSGTLQQSSSPNGGFADVQNAASPYTAPIDAPQKFYRVKVQ